MDSHIEQRRKHMRVQCQVPIEVIEPVNARLETVNLSLGGAYCSSTVPLSSGVKITCMIRARYGPRAREDLQVDALICRSLLEEHDDKRQMVALQFLDIPAPAENRLKNILEKITGVFILPSRPGPQE